MTYYLKLALLNTAGTVAVILAWCFLSIAGAAVATGIVIATVAIVGGEI